MDYQRLKETVSRIELPEDRKSRILAACHRAKKPVVVLWKPVLAVCASLLVIAAIWWQHGSGGQTSPELLLQSSNAPATAEDTRIPAAERESTAPAPQEIIKVNALGDGGAVADRLKFEPEIYDRYLWDESDYLTYFGRDIRPTVIPEGLTAEPVAGACIVEKSTGKIVYDTAWLTCWNGTYEDGSPLAECDGGRGYTVKASKVGLVTDCVICWPDDMEKSVVSGVEVTIGYRSMGYNYNEDHEPMDCYDLYVAYFTCGGISYEVVSSDLDLDTFVGVLRSLIHD